MQGEKRKKAPFEKIRKKNRAETPRSCNTHAREQTHHPGIERQSRKLSRKRKCGKRETQQKKIKNKMVALKRFRR